MADTTTTTTSGGGGGGGGNTNTATATAASAAAAAGGGKKRKKWFPLESNPDVINQYMRKLGCDTTTFCYQDVLATEDWALAMVPKPVIALMLLFPIKEASEAHKEEEQARIDADGQTLSDKVYFVKQVVGNACGTIGLVHAVANNSDRIKIASDSWFDKLVNETATMNADERAVYLEDAQELEDAHEEAASEGQSEQTMHVTTHFIAFIEKDGCLYEMDGRKTQPINHGSTTKDTLLFDAVKVIKQFMARDPDEMRFTIMALAQPPSE